MEAKRQFGISTVVLVAAISLCFSATLAGAQTYTFNSAAFATGTQPDAMATADFNGDGNPDMAIANFKDNTVSVLIGAPGGMFQKQVTYAVGVNPTGVVSGDFNNDGKLDLAVANQNCPELPCSAAGTVSILLGNGNGTFQKALPGVNADDAPNAIVAADFNKDGNLDVAVVNTQSDNVTVLLGTGTGTFSAGTNYSVGTSPEALVTGDYNNDGIPDLAVENKKTSDVSVFLGNGNGTFNAQPSVPTGTFPVYIVSGDFNGDGKLDMATANSFVAGSGVSLMLGNGNGTFQAHKDFALMQPGTALTAADFNEDGKLDLAVTSMGSQSVGVLLGNGNGTFQAHVDYLIGAGPAAILSGDINNDGAADLEVVSSTNNTVTVLPGTGTGAFQLNGSVSVSAKTEPNPSSVVVGDFQGTGKAADIAIADFATGTVTILLSNGNGSYTVQPAITVGKSLVAIAAKDVNADTKVDLVVADDEGKGLTSGVWVLLGNGDGTFKTPVSYALNSAPTCVLIDDYNDDGKQDLAVCDKGISILFGNGDGTFGTATNYSTGGNTFPVAATDGMFVSGAGLDIAVAASGTNSVVVMLNRGNGTFADAVSFPVNAGPNGIASSDFNHDGFIDLVVTSTGTNHAATVSFLSGNGNGSFNTPVEYPAPQGALSLLAQDLNGDSKADLAIGYSNNNGNGIAVMTGNGNGTFNPFVNHVTSWGAKGSQGKYEGIAIGDLNGDFAPDVVAADEETNLVSWYFNSSLAAPSPRLLNFGNQKVGTTSNPLTVRIENSGSASLTVSNVSTAAPFAETNTCTDVLPGGTCTISVTFTPTVDGQATGTLTVTDSSPTGQQKVSLTGNGD